MLGEYTPNGGAQVEQLDDGCLRCCETLDWTDTLQIKMYQEWQRKDNQRRKLNLLISDLAVGDILPCILKDKSGRIWSEA